MRLQVHNSNKEHVESMIDEHSAIQEREKNNNNA